MTYEELKKQFNEACENFGFRPLFDFDLIEKSDRTLDVFHVGEKFKLAESDFGLITLENSGELKARLLDENGGEISDDYSDIFGRYITTDNAFDEAYKQGKLELDCDCWFELAFYKKVNDNYEYMDAYEGMATDCVYGSLEEAIKGFIKLTHDKEYANALIVDMRHDEQIDFENKYCYSVVKDNSGYGEGFSVGNIATIFGWKNMGEYWADKYGWEDEEIKYFNGLEGTAVLDYLATTLNISFGKVFHLDGKTYAYHVSKGGEYKDFPNIVDVYEIGVGLDGETGSTLIYQDDFPKYDTQQDMTMSVMKTTKSILNQLKEQED